MQIWNESRSHLGKTVCHTTFIMLISRVFSLWSILTGDYSSTVTAVTAGTHLWVFRDIFRSQMQVTRINSWPFVNSLIEQLHASGHETSEQTPVQLFLISCDEVTVYKYMLDKLHFHLIFQIHRLIDALVWSKVTVKTFIMWQKISISNKCCSWKINHGFHKYIYFIYLFLF